jgi:tetratricopeptide (TPR) repeat protein
MNFLKRDTCISLIITFVLFGLATMVYAQNKQVTLNQYVVDLQKNPNDYGLREKIIKLVRTMRPVPNIPEEADRFMARGTAAVKNAKTPNDFKDAVNEFEKATLAAPWLASAYYNLGIARDKAGLYAGAIKSLNLYLLASPNAADVKAVKNLIYEIEYKQEKTAKESSPEAIAEKNRQAEEDFIKKLDGVRYIIYDVNEYHNQNWTIDILGKRVIRGQICRKWTPPDPNCDVVWRKIDETTLNGCEFILANPWGAVCASDRKTPAVDEGKISDDGKSITVVSTCGGPSTIYNRER